MNIILVAKLVGELSWAWAAAFSALVVVPLLALLRVQRRHEQRVDRFVRAGEVEERTNIVIVRSGISRHQLRADPDSYSARRIIALRCSGSRPEGSCEHKRRYAAR